MIIPYVNPLLPLDQCKDTPSKAAYSLRRLRSGYKDNAIRVRRSSDNAELDIPFCGTDLCLSTLIAFVTTNSAYVVTWYDQSGNGNHVTQATAGNQPRIVNAGVIDVDLGGKPTIQFTSTGHTTDFLVNTTFVVSNLVSILEVATPTVSGSFLGSFWYGSAASATNLIYKYYNHSTVFNVIGMVLPETQIASWNEDILGKQNIISYTRSSTISQKSWKNGTLKSSNVNTTTNFTSDAIGIGSRRSGTLNTGYWNGNISELIMTTPLSDTQRIKIERNQSKYYGINVA